MKNLSITITKTAALDLRKVSTNPIKAVMTDFESNKIDVQANKSGKGYILRANTDITIFSGDEESNLSDRHLLQA